MSVHYLDHAATTPMRPAALETMVGLLADRYGNPSGAHRMAREANRVLDEARDVLADALGAEPGQVVFTSGGTEADNLAITGTLEALRAARPDSAPIGLCSAIEHHAVLDPILHHGGRAIPVGSDGIIDLDRLAGLLEAWGDQVAIVSIMAANNEIGVLQPLGQVVALVRELAPHAVVHTDAVQALCWVDLAETAAECDLMSVSAHKFGGPKGVGALVVRDRADLAPLARGGGQERGRRGGTHNVAGIAAMATAAAETVVERGAAVRRVAALRDRLVAGVLATVDGATRTASDSVTAGIAHFCFEGVESEALLFLLEKHDIMASAASSCSSGAMEPSHVLAALGVDRSLALGSLRLSLGYSSTDADVDAVLATLPDAVARLRDRS